MLHAAHCLPGQADAYELIALIFTSWRAFVLWHAPVHIYTVFNPLLKSVLGRICSPIITS